MMADERTPTERCTDGAMRHLTRSVEFLRSCGLYVDPATINLAQRFYREFYPAHPDLVELLDSSAAEADVHRAMKRRIEEFGKSHPDEFAAVMLLQGMRAGIMQQLARTAMAN
jgi:hypothetical protein